MSVLAEYGEYNRKDLSDMKVQTYQKQAEEPYPQFEDSLGLFLYSLCQIHFIYDYNYVFI